MGYSLWQHTSKFAGNIWRELPLNFDCSCIRTAHCSFGDGFFWMFQAPGNATGGIGVPNNAWNTRIASYKCWPSPDCLGHRTDEVRPTVYLQQ